MATVDGHNALDVPAAGRLILASSSPRRRELLASAGREFEVVPPSIPEPVRDSPPRGPIETAEALAYFKARSVWQAHPRAWVLGADTVVAHQGRIIGKPSGPDDARATLEALAGTRHAVITGVALLGPPSRRLIASETTYVTMRKMSDREVRQYIDSGEWQGKAGAYAIQETADRFVEAVEGSFTNVVGLPMELVERMLATVQLHRPAAPEG